VLTDNQWVISYSTFTDIIVASCHRFWNIWCATLVTLN